MSKARDTTPPTVKKCVVCGKHATSVCKKCKEAWYCSPGCQKYDWKLHKHLCAESPYPPKDPAKRSVRGIHFPENGSGPFFLELALTEECDEDDGVHWDRLHQEPIFPDDWFIQEVHVARNLVSDQDLGYTIKIGVKEDGLVDKRCTTNLCIHKLNTTTCPILHPWPGPLRAVKIASNPRYLTTETYLDIEISDLRHVMDYFVLYLRQGAEMDKAIAQLRQGIPAFSKSTAVQAGVPQAANLAASTKGSQAIKGKGKQLPKPVSSANTTSTSDLPLGSTRPTVPSGSAELATKKSSPRGLIHGVKIHCRGDQTDLRVAKFVAVSLSPDEIEEMSIFNRPIAPISALIEFPIRVYQVPTPESRWEDDKRSPENQSATFLHLDPQSGWAPFYWQNDVGTVLLVRDDRKELYIEHVDALCEFCQHYLGPLFGEWVENGRQKGTPEAGTRKVDYEMTRGGFEAWFERYRIQQAMRVLGVDSFRRNSLGLNFKFQWERWITPWDVKS